MKVKPNVDFLRNCSLYKKLYITYYVDLIKIGKFWLKHFLLW